MSEVRRLHFTIHRCSSHLPGLPPQNVLVDKPSDQTSRWSTSTNTPPQYLMLKLNRPAIVKAITFGKYSKTHSCNLKKFSVFGGMQDENLAELLSGGLENNTSKETFLLRHMTSEGKFFPVQYISIIPHLSWGPSFYFSIWYLEFHGIDDSKLVRRVLFEFNMFSERETIRMCLKHFRQQKYTTAFNALQKKTGVTLESPQLSCLYQLLVEDGDFDAAEKLLQNAANDGLFNWYSAQQPYISNWINISPCSPDLVARLTESTETPPACSPTPPLTSTSPVPENTISVTQVLESCIEALENDRHQMRPRQRGGHQMVLDPVMHTLYLFGGWDGVNDLSDLWSYNIPEEKWTLIYKCSEKHGGPGPRSCHKMVLDPVKRQIFVIGRYLEGKNRTKENTKSDMYLFDMNDWKWYKICDDAASRGGPSLIFDHQMCIDIEKHIIYVFGGRILPAISDGDANSQYSGLYAYFISEDRWQLLLADMDAEVSTDVPTILSRFGHSMLLHPITHTLYIFGGIRNKENQTDLLTVDVENVDSSNSDPKVSVRAVCNVTSPRRAPPSGFTQRATIDPELNEIYVLSGLSKEKDKRVSNSLWVYSIATSQWSCIYKNDDEGYKYWCKSPVTEPCPRFAHQLVYDPLAKVHYLFGGNPGRPGQPNLRLDDFWILRLTRTNTTSALWRARLELRRLRFQELTEEGRSHEALAYLQNNLYQATDHSDPEQERQFQLLATMLFSERTDTISFNPPFQAKKSEIRISDPKLNDDISDEEIQNQPSQFSSVSNSLNPEVEQQMLFAAVLGMDSINSDAAESNSCSYNLSDKYFNELLHEDEKPVLGFVDNEIEDKKWNEWETHYRRCQLFQQLSGYFPQHMVQPKKNLTDFLRI